MPPSSRKEFAIAIICALTLEGEAVEQLFDETYDRLSEFYKKQPGDDNAYINGRIGVHNVVLCYMPGMGKTSAASVAASMKISYTGIKVALVVGICGGGPYSPLGEPIFLGDVIISDAVIEYDFGRQYPGGFQRKTGVKETLGKPNREIRSVLAGLKASQSRKEVQDRILQYLGAAQKSESRWHRPSLVEDVVYEASYPHRHYGQVLAIASACVCFDLGMPHGNCQKAQETDCGSLGCDDSQICRRRSDPEMEVPAIHFGTMASADMVMKSGLHRNNLMNREKVIGFEMEGAGVWDNIPCVIIKGVSDYADSHKNKAWQAYAAATGAAATKAFLEFWPPIQVMDEFHISLDLTTIPAIEGFIGRQDSLTCLWDYLQPAQSQQKRKVAVLHGLGGIGKTQLAIHFARQHKNDFTAIFWLTGKNRSALILSLSSCLPRIQPERQPAIIKATNEDEAERRARQVLQWLAMPGNTRWLIIFDNVDQYSPPHDHDKCPPQDCGYDIHEFFPNADHGSIILTSRLQALTELGKSFPVQKLNDTDATHLLLQSSGLSALDMAQGETAQDITNLGDRLSGLPLAIVLAGAYMRETGTSVKEYLTYYQKCWIYLQTRTEPPHQYEKNIIQVWMATYEQIQKCDPTTALLLLFLACFDNRDIWFGLVRCGFGTPSPDWLNEVIENKLVFKMKIKTLVNLSMVEMKQQEDSYTMHPVVQDWCRYYAAVNGHAIQLYELALTAVGYFVPSDDNTTEHATLQRRLLPHADCLIRRQIFQKLEDHLPGERSFIWGSVQRLGILYSDHGKPEEAERMYRRALRGFENTLGPDHESALGVVYSLGMLYKDQGKLEKAEEMCQRVLAGIEKENTLGPHHPLVIDIPCTLGNVYLLQDRLEEGERMHQRALTGKENTLGSDHPSTLKTVATLGHLYIRQGKIKEAEEMYQRILTTSPDTNPALDALNNLGNIYRNQDKLSEAEKMYQKALEGKENTLGIDHTSTLDTVHNFGILYIAQGKPDEAEKMYQRALIGRERALGPDHTSTIDSLTNLALVYRRQGKLEQSEEMLQRAVRGYENALGPDHLKTRQAANTLASLTNTLQGTLPERPRKREVLSSLFRGKWQTRQW